MYGTGKYLGKEKEMFVDPMSCFEIPIDLCQTSNLYIYIYIYKLQILRTRKRVFIYIYFYYFQTIRNKVSSTLWYSGKFVNTSWRVNKVPSRSSYANNDAFEVPFCPIYVQYDPTKLFEFEQPTVELNS